MIMQNTALLQDPDNSKLTFDMKGSIENRKVRFNNKYKQFWLKKLNYKKVMKDLNFLEINRDSGYTLMKLTTEQNKQLN